MHRDALVARPTTPAPRAPSEDPMALSEDLLSILVCPQCRGDLNYDRDANHLTCPGCKLRYRVVDDIPVMLIDQAEKLT